jgi:hypothetical protein
MDPAQYQTLLKTFGRMGIKVATSPEEQSAVTGLWLPASAIGAQATGGEAVAQPAAIDVSMLRDFALKNGYTQYSVRRLWDGLEHYHTLRRTREERLEDEQTHQDVAYELHNEKQHGICPVSFTDGQAGDKRLVASSLESTAKWMIAETGRAQQVPVFRMSIKVAQLLVDYVNETCAPVDPLAFARHEAVEAVALPAGHRFRVDPDSPYLSRFDVSGDEPMVTYKDILRFGKDVLDLNGNRLTHVRSMIGILAGFLLGKELPPGWEIQRDDTTEGHMGSGVWLLDKRPSSGEAAIFGLEPESYRTVLQSVYERDTRLDPQSLTFAVATHHVTAINTAK